MWCLERTKTPQVDGKAIASVFWDVHRIIYIDYFQKEKSNSDFYIELLACLKNKILKKPPHMMKKKIIFYQDNALYDKLMKIIAKLNELGFDLFSHSPYCTGPQLQPIDKGDKEVI